jgi:hypothetical protein
MSKSVQLDERLTASKVGDALVNLYQCTGIRAFAVFLGAMLLTQCSRTAWTRTTLSIFSCMSSITTALH